MVLIAFDSVHTLLSEASTKLSRTFSSHVDAAVPNVAHFHSLLALNCMQE
jgi:hypothetical protein